MTPQNPGASPFFRLLLGPPHSVSVGSRTFLGNLRPSYVSSHSPGSSPGSAAPPGLSLGGPGQVFQKRLMSEWPKRWSVPGVSWTSRQAFPGFRPVGDGRMRVGRVWAPPRATSWVCKALTPCKCSPGSPGLCSAWRRCLGGTPKIEADRCHLFKVPGNCNLFVTSLSLLGSPRRVTGLFSHKQRTRWPGRHPDG